MSKKLINNHKEFSFFYPGNINQKTGGYIYEKNIFQYSKKNNLPIKFIELSNNFPNPKKIDLKKFVNKTKLTNIAIIDGLVLEGLHQSMEILKNLKSIALIHHPLYLEYKGLKSIKFFKRAQKIYKHINYFIVTSKQTKKLLIENFNIKSSKISIVEPGIDKLKKFKKIKSNKIKILTCGSIIERKKYDYLINEIKNINNIELNIIGDTSRETDYSKNIIKNIKTNKLTKKIILHGSVTQSKLEKLYSNSDFYISTSKYEGFGMSLANAVISNLPIISFRTSTIKNTIGSSGVLYFDNYKKNTLKNIILNNCFDKKKYKILKSKFNKYNKYLTTKESAKLFIKTINNAQI